MVIIIMMITHDDYDNYHDCIWWLWWSWLLWSLPSTWLWYLPPFIFYRPGWCWLLHRFFHHQRCFSVLQGTKRINISGQIGIIPRLNLTSRVIFKWFPMYTEWTIYIYLYYIVSIYHIYSVNSMCIYICIQYFLHNIYISISREIYRHTV